MKENFLNDYRDSIREVDAQVIEEYIATLRSHCYKERKSS